MRNEYYLNGQPLSGFGFVPGHADGSNLAISGAWDMPKRAGECYYAWQEGDGVEAYVDAEDIAFAAREIRLSGTITAQDGEGLRDRLEAFRAFIVSLPAFCELRCCWGCWCVSMREETGIEIKGARFGEVALAFIEATPDLSGACPPQWLLATRRWNPAGEWDPAALWYERSAAGAWILEIGLWEEDGAWRDCGEWYGDEITDIDMWRWRSFGLTLSAVGGMATIPAAREIKITQPEPETLYAPGGREPRSITLEGWLTAADMAEFESRVRSLYWLFGSAGLRRLVHKGRRYFCFACEGFTLTDIQKRDKVYAKFKIKLLESGNE